MAYVDLVLCSDNKQTCLVVAPRFSYLKTGDEVIIESKQGAKKVKVKDVLSVNDESEIFKFVVAASGATLPLRKVLKKINYENFNYKEDSTSESC